jgi:penicillin-binding protein 1A
MHKGRRSGKDWVADLSTRFFVARLLVTMVTVALALAGLVVLGFAGAHQFLEPEIPDAAELREIRTQMPLAVYTRDGRLIAQIGEQRRVPVAWDEIPPQLVDAFLAAEDDRFFEHPGVDWQGLVRAAISNVSAGGVREGGGTITMQLARNTVLTNERTLRRKLKEVFLALRLEREFSKQEILTLYLNRIFLGQRAYGVGAAAQVYFDKRPAELTLADAALIAGLPRSPSLDNPVASVERARDRRAYVLRRMAETGKISEAERAAADAVPVEARIHGPIVELSAPYVAEMARLEMVQRFGDAALTEGYRVTTTVDSRLQAAADAAARRTLLAYDRRHGYRGAAARLDASVMSDPKAFSDALREYPGRGGLAVGVVESVQDRSAVVRRRDGIAIELGWDDLSWARPALPDDVLGTVPKAAADVVTPGDVVYLEPLPEGRHRLAQVPAVAGALVALEPRDGAIVALVGGFDFGGSKYNRAVQAKRQPGSAFKPFVYSAALERGFTPASLINDAPIVIEGGAGTEEWRPQNITKRFYGPTPLREALVRSRNLVSIRLLRATGIGPAMRHIGAFGFGPEALPANLTLALGTGQVTPLDMARGYAVFANGGFRVTPHLIERITDSHGLEVYAATPEVACADCPGEPAAPQAISPANAFVMTDVMTDVIQRGTATSAKSLGRSDLAGKTGTTNDRRDAWFVGFNADYVAAVWVGFDQERSLGDNEEGGRTALPMWVGFMEEALRDRPEHRLPEPPGVVRMWVDRNTGRPTAAGGGGAVFEAFLESHMPQMDSAGVTDEVGAESVEPAAADDTLF